MLQTDKIKNIINCLSNGLRDNLWGIVLFGSSARNEPAKDLDIFIVADNLPLKFMGRMQLLRKLLPTNLKGLVSIIAKTRQEFESTFPSYYLDIGLDGIILYEKNNYLTESLNKIKELIKIAGLHRKKLKNSFFWEWTTPPASAWQINWKGVYGL